VGHAPPHAIISIYTGNYTTSADANLPQGPDVWICGDCHLGNMGPLADAEGHISFQIRDLDQAVVGNPALDLIRLASAFRQRCAVRTCPAWYRRE
jgi:uncharacterized protein (DUF2252 family)